jgi:hypothetical protein
MTDDRNEGKFSTDTDTDTDYPNLQYYSQKTIVQLDLEIPVASRALPVASRALSLYNGP